MERIFNKQTVLYLVIAMAVVVLASLTFFTWRDGRSLSTDVSQKKRVALNESAQKKRSAGKTRRRLTASESAVLHRTKNRQPTPATKVQETQIQVDTQKVMPPNRLRRRRRSIKYEGLFEKAKDLEVNGENIIQAGE